MKYKVTMSVPWVEIHLVEADNPKEAGERALEGNTLEGLEGEYDYDSAKVLRVEPLID